MLVRDLHVFGKTKFYLSVLTHSYDYLAFDSGNDLIVSAADNDCNMLVWRLTWPSQNALQIVRVGHRQPRLFLTPTPSPIVADSGGAHNDALQCQRCVLGDPAGGQFLSDSAARGAQCAGM